MKNYKDIIYAVTCLSFTLILGAAFFEHLAVWPRAYAAPPSSLGMFQGDYGLNAGAFWIKIHPVTLVLFIITLVLFWKTDRRKYIAIPFIGYFIILVITSFYFVPELMDITGTEMASSVDADLQNRSALWVNLSLIRTAVLVVLAIILFLGLTKSVKQQE